jgi:polyferredoxin
MRKLWRRFLAMWPAWRAQPGVEGPPSSPRLGLCPQGSSRKGPRLVWLRRLSQAAFLSLFLFFLVRTEYRGNFAEQAQEASRTAAVVGAALETHRALAAAGGSLAGALVPALALAAGDGQHKTEILDSLLPEIRLDLPTSAFLQADPLVAVSTSIATRSLHDDLVWALVLLGLTVLLGRFFCGWICPLGTLHHLFSWVRPSRVGARRIQANLTRPYQWIKYYLLIALLVASVFTTLQVGLLDPICFLTRSLAMSVLPAIDYGLRSLFGALHSTDASWLQGAAEAGFAAFDGTLLSARPAFYHWGWVLGAIFIVVMLLNRYVTRFWCRALCPLGALLGLFSRFSIFGLEKDHARCTHCNLCLLHCQAADSPQGGVKWQGSECHLCFNCESVCPEDVLHFKFFPQLATSVAPAPDLKKRAALLSGFAGLALYPMSRASDGVKHNYDSRVIRPPGAVEEERFLERCIKCCACMKVCPNNALHPALFEAGLEGVWSPLLIPRIGYCEHECVLCGSVCPTGAIRNISVHEKVGRGEFAGRPIKLGTAFYDKGRCLPWSMDTPCIVCEEICPTSPKAIWAEDVWVTKGGKPVRLQQPRVDPQLCIGCGACEKVCPVKDRPAIYVTPIGESRSRDRQLLLDMDAPSNDARWRRPDLGPPGAGPEPVAAKREVKPDPRYAQQARPDRPATQRTALAEREAAGRKARRETAGGPEADPLAALLPRAIGDHVPKAPARSFDRKTLFAYMNGAAPGFLDYGFQRLVVGEYAKATKKGEPILVEVFDMGSPKGAFGKYSAERDPGYDFFDLGVQGYAGGGNVVFWARRFYVKVTGGEDTPAMTTLLKSFARSVAARIGSPGKPLAVFERFPSRGRLKHTERYVPRRFAEVSGLGGGFSVDFKDAGREFSLFVLDLTGEGRARAALARIQARFPGAKRETVAGDEVLAVAGEEDALLFLRRKGEVVGVRGRMPHEEALRWARRLWPPQTP